MSKTTLSNEISILKKQDILLVPIQNFFNNEKHLDLLLGILITGKYKISLRIIDWFVTNYSKKHNLVLNNNKPFIVYLEYKSQLKAYSKKQFDPFCRRSRIYYEYAKDKTFETTIGQLNFFRWAIQNKIIDYIMKNYETIEKDMNDTIKTSRSTDSSPKTPNSLSSAGSGGSSSIQLESFESNSITESSSSSVSKESKSSKKKSTITATKNICKHNVKIIVSFD
jgi:hypothetical protein